MYVCMCAGVLYDILFRFLPLGFIQYAYAIHQNCKLVNKARIEHFNTCTYYVHMYKYVSKCKYIAL